MKTRHCIALAVLLVCLLLSASAQQENGSAEIFDKHGDIGETPKTGSLQYDAATREYRITGGGANIWGTVDAFHYAWKQMSGDVVITADVHFVGTGAVAHRKAVLMMRQSLDPGSAYADVALHGDGLTSLQYRTAAGAETLEVRSSENAPVRIRLERRGNQFTMYAGKPGEKLVASEPITVTLQDPVYVGIGISSHDANVLETAVFSNVAVEKPAAQ